MASTLEIGAESGRQMSDLMPFFVAASATPCAWLPAEQAITPFAFSSAESWEILYAEPRTLKEPVICKFSGFRYRSQSGDAVGLHDVCFADDAL